MPQPRLLASSLLASSLLASAAIVLPAVGQSHPTTLSPPLAATITSPSILTLDANSAPSTTTLNSLPPGSYTFRASKDAPLEHITVGKPFKLSKDAENYLKLHKDDHETRALAALHSRVALTRQELSQSQSPCLTLRVYNFTERDLKSIHPRPSSETDCTPASRGHLLMGPLSSVHPTTPATQTVPIPAIPK